MNDSPLLSKMDALLKKHRGSNEPDVHALPGLATAPEAPRRMPQDMPPADAWLPVLTDVIERGTPLAVSAPAAAAPPPAAQSAKPETPVAVTPSSIVSDTLAEQLMSELAPRLSEVMEKQVAAELRKNLDQTVATLLSQLDGDVREIVREAIADKIRKPRDPST